MFPKKYRLNTKEINKAIRKGRSYKSPFFYLKTAKNDLGHVRVGVAAGIKTFKKATERNHYRRVLKSVLKETLPSLEIPYDIVLIAREDIKKQNFENLKNDARKLLQQAGI